MLQKNHTTISILSLPTLATISYWSHKAQQSAFESGAMWPQVLITGCSITVAQIQIIITDDTRLCQISSNYGHKHQ